MWPAAAAAVVVFALVPVWMTRTGEGPTVTRGGTSLAPVNPVGTTVAIGEVAFEWRGTGPTDRVRLNVVDLDRPDLPLIEREVTGSRYEPTAEERGRFRSGQSLYWYVEALTGSGGAAPAANFTVR